MQVHGGFPPMVSPGAEILTISKVKARFPLSLIGIKP